MLNRISARVFKGKAADWSFLTFFLTFSMIHVLFCSLAHGQGFILSPGWGYPFPLVQRSRPGEILIRFKVGTPPLQIATIIQQYGLRQVSSSPFSGIQRMTATASINGDLLQILRMQPQIAYAEANFIRRINEVIPNDPLFAFQWHLNINELPLAWDLSTGQGITIAVLDTGVSYENYGEYALAPDLANTKFLPGWDFINNDGHPNDDNRHGTHITGIIAQSTNNLIGGAGVAFQSNILPVKVLDETGSGDVSTIVDGIYYAVNNGAQIINLSFGSVADPSSSEEEAINYAVDHGILIICSAGNEVTNQPHYPSSYANSISVTATRFDNQFAAAYSNFGPDVDLAAPGGDLSLDQDGDGSPDGIYQETHNGTNFKKFDFYYSEGTSSACAYVSGVAALILSRGGGQLSPAEAREILESTAIDLGPPGWDEQYGWGIVNPFAAVLAVDTLLSPRSAAAQGFLSPFLSPSLSQSLLLRQQLNAIPLLNALGLNMITGDTRSQTRSAANNGTFATGQNFLLSGLSGLSGIGISNPGFNYGSNSILNPGALFPSYFFPASSSNDASSYSQRITTAAKSGTGLTADNYLADLIVGNYSANRLIPTYNTLLWSLMTPQTFIPFI